MSSQSFCIALIADIPLKIFLLFWKYVPFSWACWSLGGVLTNSTKKQFFSVGSVHVKTSVSLMLGSVVNTLEQRGEWLNGGRGAAKRMIDRLSANQVTPFGAAEHLEFWSRWCWGVCARMAPGREKKPARMEVFSTCCCRARLVCRIAASRRPRGAKAAPRARPHKAPERQGNTRTHAHTRPRVEPCISAGTSLAVSGGRFQHKSTPRLRPIWRPLLSDTFFLFVSRLS